MGGHEMRWSLSKVRGRRDPGGRGQIYMPLDLRCVLKIWSVSFTQFVKTDGVSQASDIRRAQRIFIE